MQGTRVSQCAVSQQEIAAQQVAGLDPYTVILCHGWDGRDRAALLHAILFPEQASRSLYCDAVFSDSADRIGVAGSSRPYSALRVVS